MRNPAFLKLIAALTLIVECAALHAGGPKYVAGTTYFNPAALGQPLHWPGGQLDYYIDQGPLNPTVSNAQATAMVDAAAALWSGVSTAGVLLTDKGPLNEDVSGANVNVNSAGQMTAPTDVTPGAIAYPVAVLYDADGSIIDSLYGATTSDPTACNTNGVFFWLDNFQPDATFAHGVIVLNGRCATTPALLTMMQFQLARAFGRILGLDFSQVNPGALHDSDPNQLLGWPVMQPPAGPAV